MLAGAHPASVWSDWSTTGAGKVGVYQARWLIENGLALWQDAAEQRLKLTLDGVLYAESLGIAVRCYARRCDRRAVLGTGYCEKHARRAR